MKLILLVMFILVTSCQDNNFTKGDCIQKPDENTIWEISSIKDGNATVVQSGPNAPEIAREFKLNSSWIKTKC